MKLFEKLGIKNIKEDNMNSDVNGLGSCTVNSGGGAEPDSIMSDDAAFVDEFKGIGKYKETSAYPLKELEMEYKNLMKNTSEGKKEIEQINVNQD